MKKLFFDEHDECHCYPTSYFDNSDIVTLAIPDKSKDYFYCKAKGECYTTIMDNGLRSCGKECDEYEPRNGKNGVCRYRTHTYKDSKVKFVIKNGRAYKI